MSAERKDYPEFIGHLARSCLVVSLLAGFTLTIFVQLIIRYFDAGSVFMEATFLLLPFLFNLFLFLLQWLSNLDFYYMKEIPPTTRGMMVCGFLETLGIGLLGLVIPLIFLFYSLTILALISFLFWLVFIVSSFIYVYKPAIKERESASRSQ